MTFPAELSFKRDRELTPSARRVYDYLTTTLDFREAKAVSTKALSRILNLNRESAIQAVGALVAHGYLLEHERGENNIRSFTLTWSVDPDLVVAPRGPRCFRVGPPANFAPSERRAVPLGLRWAILDRDGHRCQSCGRSVAIDGVVLHVDHIVPWSLGGKTEPANLESLCSDCNIGKSNRLPRAVPPGETP